MNDRKLMLANAERGMAQRGPGAKAPTAASSSVGIQSNSELAVQDLQAAIAAHAKELRRRAIEGSATSADMKATAMLAASAAKLAAEEREQAAQVSLALASDEDIADLLVSTLLAMPETRRVDLIKTIIGAMPSLNEESP